MKKRKNGFTLIELLISIGLLAIVSVVSLSIVTSLLRSSVKAQMAVDVEQASSFVFLKLENDIKNSYKAGVSSNTLTLYQGSPVSPTTVIYTINTLDPANGVYITRNTTSITDNSKVNGKSSASAVWVDPTSSFTSIVDGSNNVVAVNINIRFFKPNAASASGAGKIFDAESTLNTSVVLRGSN